MILKKKIGPQGLISPPHRGNIHEYYHNIQTSSSLKPLGQSKPNFKRIICRKGVINVYINNPGHMTKMAAIAIYGKNPSKIFFSRTGGSISKKLGMKHRWLKYYNVHINHDPVMTMTFFYGKVNIGRQCI